VIDDPTGAPDGETLCEMLDRVTDEMVFDSMGAWPASTIRDGIADHVLQWHADRNGVDR
jgi:hypothetical protein